MYVYNIAKTHQPIDPKTHQKPWVDGFLGKNPGFLGTLVVTYAQLLVYCANIHML